VKTLRLFLATAAAAAMVLLLAQPASAQPVQPAGGQGLISLTQQVCGSSASWRQQSVRLGLAQTGPRAHWLSRGKTYDIVCPGSAAPAAPPAVVSNAWVNPLPGTCRPSWGGGQWGAPRDDNGDGITDRYHAGIDLGGVEGRPVWTHVLAAHAGVVTAVQYGSNTRGAGNVLVVDAGGGWSYRYHHLRGFEVSVGQRVTAGQFVAYMGGAYHDVGAGNSTGPHVHVEVRLNGAARNPGGAIPVGC
jgi:murein DD-endopeptidase MepM/ murein hydrolase activator NlpD